MAAAVSQDVCSPYSVLYSPLDRTRPQIRLIKILPSEADDEQVSCRLETVELSEDTRYAALSYVWGDPKITENIMVNSVNLPVTANLASALQHFRKFGFPHTQKTKDLQYLWVDAICINQDESDVSEKNHQVALMGEIYKNAVSVLSWLGPPDSTHVDTALRTIHTLAPLFLLTEYSLANNTEYEKISALYQSTYSSLFSVMDSGSLDWKPIIAFRNSVYWTRMWIIQEIVLAKSPCHHWLICGKASITFLELIMFNHVLTSVGEISLPRPNGFTPQWSKWHKQKVLSKAAPLLTLHTKFLTDLQTRPQNELGVKRKSLFHFACIIAKSCSATRPQDFVYALLGIIPDIDIKPDYGNPVREVYLNALLSDETPRWDCYFSISGSGLGVINEHHLPSWVPDLSKLRLVPSNFTDTRCRNVPLLGIKVAQPQVIAEDTLCIDGVVCDHVELVKPLDFSPGHREHNSKAIYRLCIDYLAEFFGNFETSCLALGLEQEWQPGQISGKINRKRPLEALFDVLDWKERDSRSKSATYWAFSGPDLSPVAWHFLIRLRSITTKLTKDEQDDALRRLNPPVGMKLGSYLQLCFAHVSLNKEELDKGLPTMREVDMRDFEAILYSVTGTSFFKTHAGYLGIGPLGLKQGDMVCALGPCSLPSLLRKVATPDGGALWEHVGPCYVLGISNGELADRVANGELKIQTFKIR